VSFLGQLIDGASGEDVSVATLLRKVKVVAARMGNVALEEWVDHELTGYPTEAVLPDYRAKRVVEVAGDFIGIMSSRIVNAPVPSSLFPQSVRDAGLFTVEFREPIAEIEGWTRGDHDGPIQAVWPANAIAHTNRLITTGEVQLYRDMRAQQVYRLISREGVAALVDTVRTRILNLALSLEEVAPEAGVRDAPAADASTLDRVVMNVYGGNVAVQSSQFKQEISLPGIGDMDALFAALHAAGVPIEEQDALRDALAADAAEGAGPSKEIGRRVREWAGSLALKGAGAAAKGGAGAGGALALKALASYFGLDFG